MEKLIMCRICLAEDVRMHLISATYLHNTYESLTTMPFETEDNRPLQVCYICCARLQNCYKLKMRCLQSEELFSQMLNMEIKVKGCTSFLKRSTVELIDITFGDVVQPSELCNQVEMECEDSDARTSKSNLDEQEMIDIVKHEPGEQTTLTSDTVEDVGSDEYLNANLEEHEMIDIVKHEPGEQTSYPVSKQSALTTEWNVALSNFKKCENSKDTIDEPEPDTAIAHEDNVLITLNERNYDVNEFNKINSISDHNDVEKEKSQSTCKKLKPYSCDSCQKCFSRKYYFEKHIRIHTGETPYQCSVCKKCFSVKSHLNRHIRSHTGEKPFQCNVCKKCFAEKAYLDNHIRTHSSKKLYRCNVCEIFFSQKSNLNSHICTHTGEKPHQCNICKKCFSEKDYLDNHIRTHSGKKLYQCNICEKYLSQKS